DRSAEELTAWCAATDRALAEAERRISEQRAAQAAGRVFGVPAEGLRPELEAPQPAGDREADTRRRAHTLARVLARLAPDVSAAERGPVLEVAEQLAAAATDGEAEALLAEVRLRVQRANEQAAARRAAERRRAA